MTDLRTTDPTSIGLFAGIGGIERGLEFVGFETRLLCEFDTGASAVLEKHFPEAHHVGDVRTLREIPPATVLSAGFPCQDLSQAGRTAGIDGERSGLVGEVFRLLDSADEPPEWVLLENVPFMLSLDRGEAMRHLTSEFGRRGFRWAYRVLDARAFGVPQRRRRVVFLASRIHDPRAALLTSDASEPATPDHHGLACGFYWTEGNRGLGWAVDAVPTLKGGSGLGIPSPPAIWMPDGSIVTPDIRDAERLQGFDPDWTLPAVEEAGLRVGARWKQVGNAVCVPMARWVGQRLLDPDPGTDTPKLEVSLDGSKRWPTAAWGEGESVWAVDVSEWPIRTPRPRLDEFLQYRPKPLSQRATSGFYGRLKASKLRRPAEFDEAVGAHEIRAAQS